MSNAQDDEFETPNASPPAKSTSAREQFGQALQSKRIGSNESDTEQSLWAGGYSSKAMFGTWLALIVGTVAAIAVAIWSESITWRHVTLLIIAAWVVGLLVYCYRRLGLRYELTSQRFMHQQGILSRQTDRIEVIDIDDVTFRQGPIERLIGVGSIAIVSSDRSHPELKMRGIDNVKQIATLIDDVRRKERRRRSVHIESI
jgi:membrane protein YdbS with pleckstrin-like domain